MADLSQVQVGSTTYDIKDATARGTFASYLPLSGGTLTGNLTGQYITGTWLKTTANTDSSSYTAVAVQDSNGVIYKRAKASFKSDMGVPTATTTTYTGISLTVAGWSGSGPYTQTYSNTALRANHPPIIICTDSNKTQYSYITSASATAGSGITFTATTKPTAAITLTVIDLG